MRHPFGGGAADYVSATVVDTPQVYAGLPVTFWDARSSGNQHEDLLDPASTPTVSVLTLAGGQLPPGFMGPDGVNWMWADAGGGDRVLIFATDLADRLAVLEGIASSLPSNAAIAALAPVQSVAGRAGAVSLSKTDVGLPLVDNTPDTAKPVSTLQAAAIALAIANLINSAPSTMDTLGEIAALLASDETAAGALTTLVAGKAPKPGSGLDGKPLQWNNSTGQFVDDTTRESATFATLDGVAGAYTQRSQVNAATDVLPNENWTWWTRPRAVAINGKTYVGTAGDANDVWIDEYSQTTDSGPLWQRRYYIGITPNSTPLDDHCNPALIIRPGKPLIAIYSGHNYDNVVYWRKSLVNIEDGIELGPERHFEITPTECTSYINAHVHGNDIYMLHRTGGTADSWSVTKSSDWGETFGSTIKLFESTGAQQIYACGAVAGDVLRVAVADHPQLGTNHNIYYFEINLLTGSIVKSDGTVLGNLDGTNLPLPQANLEVVATPPGDGPQTWVFDISTAPNPEIAWISGNGGNTTVLRYHYALRTGGVWASHDIVGAGRSLDTNAYWGSTQFITDGSQGVIYIGREASGVHYIEKWTTTDGGVTWSTQVLQQADSTHKLTRAWPVDQLDDTGMFEVVVNDIASYVGYNTSWQSTIRPLPLSLDIKRWDPLATTTDVVAAVPDLDLPSSGVYLPGTSGTYISSPDLTLPSTGLMLEVDCALDNWASGVVQNLLAKEASGTQRSIRLAVNTDGKIIVYWSEDGSTAKSQISAPTPGFANKQRVQIRIAFVPVFNVTQRRIKAWMRTPGATQWTELWTSQATPSTSLFDSTSSLEIGSRNGGTTELAAGTFYSAAVRTLGGTAIAEWRGDTAAGSNYRDGNGNIWTLNGAGAGYAAAWNGGGLLALGGYHFWMNASGNLMVKNGIPNSDTDGVLVSAAAVPVDLISALGLLTVGESSVPRVLGGAQQAAWTSGSVRLTYFTARKSETVNNIAAVTGLTAAAATPSLCKLGLYTVDGSGNLTLVASTANDTTMFATASSEYVRALTAPYAKVAGQVYATAILIVSSATMPTFVGGLISSTTSRRAPVLSGALGAQTDLPATISVGSITASGAMPSVTVTP